MTVETSFLGITLANPLMNASGVHCMTVAEMDELAQSAAEPSWPRRQRETIERVIPNLVM